MIQFYGSICCVWPKRIKQMASYMPMLIISMTKRSLIVGMESVPMGYQHPTKSGVVCCCVWFLSLMWHFKNDALLDLQEVYHPCKTSLISCKQLQKHSSWLIIADNCMMILFLKILNLWWCGTLWITTAMFFVKAWIVPAKWPVFGIVCFGKQFEKLLML